VLIDAHDFSPQMKPVSFFPRGLYYLVSLLRSQNVVALLHQRLGRVPDDVKVVTHSWERVWFRLKTALWAERTEYSIVKTQSSGTSTN